MGIKNGLMVRFTEVGKIKIGGKGKWVKTKNGKDMQEIVKFNHFVVTTTEKGQDGNFVIDQKIMKTLGPEPKEIAIRLPFDSIEMNFFTSFQYYAGKKCACRGDGKNATRWTKEGVEQSVKCNPDKCEFMVPDVKGNTKCKPSGILSCHIPASMEAGAVYRFRTHSWHSVSGILAALKYISDNTNGILQGLPLKMKFLKKATAEHGNVNIVTVVLDGIEMMAMRDAALLEYENRKSLGINMKTLENQAKAVGFLDDHDDPEDVQTEFYTVDTEPEPKDPGVSADDVKEKIEAKAEKAKPEVKEGQGSLL